MATQMTAEAIRKRGEVREEQGTTLVQVRALAAVRDNGRTHAAGETFEMELTLAAAHLAAGVVELVEGGGGGKPVRRPAPDPEPEPVPV